jgi:proline dehydrogenase
MSLFDKIIVLMLPFVPKPIVGYFSKTYIAGSTLDDAVSVVKDLNNKGMMATVDLLGEEVSKREQAIEAADMYKKILKTINKEKLDANVSVKPTQMGLHIDKKFCENTIRLIVEQAKELDNFVRIDMEDRSVTTDTIDIYLKLKQDFNEHVGTVVQAYLRRTSADIQNLVKQKANIRLCKGIYNEPRQAAYKQMPIINENFKYGLEQLLKNGCYVGIATHDEILVWHALKLIEEMGLKKDEYEFQMLLGVDESLRDIIVNTGHRLRVYVPFGKDWYPYSIRRLKENPKMAGYVFKAIFGIGQNG